MSASIRAGGELFRPPVDREIEKELEFHIAMRVKDLVARGKSPAEAQRIARAEIGDMASVMDECRTIGRRRERQMNRSRIVDEITRDVAFAVRLLRRRPLFAALAIFTIALGIGAATSIFSVVDRRAPSRIAVQRSEPPRRGVDRAAVAQERPSHRAPCFAHSARR